MSSILFSTLLFVLVSFQAAEANSQPVVKLDVYQAHGFVYQYQENGQNLSSNVYLALPYARPPLGQLRLERPVPLPSNPTRIVNNTDLPPGCVQQEDMAELDPPNGRITYPTSEDCLMLNIFTPSTPPPKGKPYPVLLWIHGGGFVYGMNRFYGWPQSARHFNSRGIVVVHIQYRLNFYGFFAFGTKKGDNANLGLFDQTASLAFVNKYISQFGGDPKQVTVMGNSAGGASTHSLSLSPYSRHFVKQTIQSSGGLYSPWSNTVKTLESSKNLSKSLGCDLATRELTKNCLKNVTVKQVHDVLKGWGRMRNSMDLIYWGPIRDDDFYDGKSLAQLNKETNVRKTLYGCTKGDGLIFSKSRNKIFSNATKAMQFKLFDSGSVIAKVFAYVIGRTVDRQANFTEADFLDHVNNYLASEDAAGPNVAEIRKLLLAYYLRGSSNASSLPEKFWYTRFTDAQTEGEFSGGQIWEMVEKMSLNWQQHVYFLDYIHPFHRPLVGIDITYEPHAYEYQYLMDAQPYFPFNKNETNPTELKFTKKLVDAFASFIKTGNPSTKAVPWPAVGKEKVKIPYLRVGQEVVAENTYFIEIAKLWQKVFSLGYAKGIFYQQ